MPPPTSTTATENPANANQLAGIRAATTVVDGGGNRADAKVVVDCEGVASECRRRRPTAHQEVSS